MALCNAFCTKRFAFWVGHRYWVSTIRDVAWDTHLDWKTVKAVENQYMTEQLRRAGAPGPQIIGIDDITIRKGHLYRIVVSDLIRGRSIRFRGTDRLEAILNLFFDEWLGPKKNRSIRLVGMDMREPFLNAPAAFVTDAAILYDKIHALRQLNEAMDKVHHSEYAPTQGERTQVQTLVPCAIAKVDSVVKAILADRSTCKARNSNEFCNQWYEPRAASPTPKFLSMLRGITPSSIIDLNF